MTLASSLLLALEPRPVSRLEPVPMQIPGETSEPLNLFETDEPIAAGRWNSVVIHDSGFTEGSAQTLAKALNIDPLPYHFVISDVNGGQEQRIEVCPRWMNQQTANLTDDDGGVLRICLIGDTDRQPLSDGQVRQLVWLVRHLQGTLGIADSQVYVRTGAGDAPDAGRLFPTASFRRQLLRQAN